MGITKHTDGKSRFQELKPDETLFRSFEFGIGKKGDFFRTILDKAFEGVAVTSDFGGVLLACHGANKTATFLRPNNVGFCPTSRTYSKTTMCSISGIHSTACSLVPFSFGLRLAGLPVNFNTGLKLAAQKQQTYLESQTGTISGTIHDFGTKKGINQKG